MKLVLPINNRTVLHAAFACWLLSEVLFAYTTISQAAMLLFTAASVIVVLRVRWPYALTGYALFVVWALLNLLTGRAADRTTAMAMTKTVFLCLVFLYGFCCYCLYIRDWREIMHVYQWVIGVLSVLSLIGGISSVLLGKRMSTFGINPNTLAMLAAYAMVMVMDEILQGRISWRRADILTLLLVLLLTILFTGSRKGLIIPICGVYVLVAFRKTGRFVVYSLATVVAAGILIWLLLHVPMLYKVVGYRVEPILLYLQGAEIQEASMESRLDYILLAWEESKESPIWGYGLDCFRLLRYAYRTYSHCNYVEILYSLGWVGVAIYYLPHVFTLAAVPKALQRDRKTTVSLLALLIPFLLCEIMNVTYFRRIFLIIPMTVMLFMPRKEQENEAA